ncbi:hypothetical protein RF11_14236 [Thelohanellus kitauei]|uniref:Uncharacterized protein n=1 Tax=Thelohanellus kitauei TaxID=669202 RepID=A0A0C2ILN9_THEKT|nr:hypothetical protein RF11_14236 [Thelohanellus kitauei]
MSRVKNVSIAVDVKFVQKLGGIKEFSSKSVYSFSYANLELDLFFLTTILGGIQTLTGAFLHSLYVDRECDVVQLVGLVKATRICEESKSLNERDVIREVNLKSCNHSTL